MWNGKSPGSGIPAMSEGPLPRFRPKLNVPLQVYQASASSGSDNGGDDFNFSRKYTYPRLQTLWQAYGDSNSPSRKNKSRMCCILAGGTGRCHAKAGVNRFSSGMEEAIDKRKINLKADSRATHRFICDAHKSSIEAAIVPPCEETESEEEVETTSSSSQGSDKEGGLDWNLLGINALRRYLDRFGIGGHDGAPKEELIKVVSRHFSTIKVASNQNNIIGEFIHRVKSQPR